MGDLLGAYSLIFAAITALYSLWYPEMQTYFHDHDWPPDVDPVNIQRQYVELKQMRSTKVIPLFIASIGIAIIFLPTVVSIVNDFFANGISFSTYDPIKICLLFLLVLNGFLIKKIFDLNSEIHGYLKQNR
ncbi:MAG: hypothetical protein GYA45_05705 [Pelolinea sp.]|jgi:hypothetical protein|nr:hypothetical protein [Pelolinea sp.]